MYSSAYGYGVYKRNQISMGKPYQIKNSSPVRVAVEDPGVTQSEDPGQKAEEILARAREEARLIIQEAELEAQRLLEQAQAQAEALAAEAEQQAKEEGYRNGESLAQQHYQELLAEAEAFRDRAKTEYEETIRSLEHDIVELSLSIARKVLGAELETSRDVILTIAAEAIEACMNRDRIVLRVSGDDYDYVTDHIEDLRSGTSNIGQIEVRKDQTLSRGACIVDTGYGMVDGSLETKMEMVEQAFREVLGELDRNE
ncbi:MAG TPA: FliH/SctL family protein [Thermoclostridium caenicola]|uniref:FliH/SctL family protein n=1 Tax=Thermoclostridium caenicola TaxID=659425 RepID=UPI002C586920|nr:FliH/SctL family protein [Thermoclostridium caenicola]HOK42043.1 FliH/SctL family protein [Thermoclostridium caenicola]HOL85419.1 FliH/SctL family protein [Thermoclostridium caenicola]HPO75834.1 FliH/SctL family protein [Thermoclostridium caenicola]